MRDGLAIGAQSPADGSDAKEPGRVSAGLF
jgi:hypothetical protein